MSFYRTSRDVLCPFYKFHDGRRIKCEGYMEGMTCLNLFYEEPYYIQYHLAKLCCDRYRDCEIYKMIIRVKYPEEE